MKTFGRFWNSLSIKIKLLSYFFTILAIVSLFSLYLNHNNYQIVDQFNATMTNYYEISQLLMMNQEGKKAVESYINERSPSERQYYEENLIKIERTIDTLDKKYNSLESQFAINAIRNSVFSYNLKWQLSMNQRENGIATYYRTFYEGERIEQYTEKYIEELLYISLREGDELYNRLANEANVMRRISLILIALFFLISLFIGVLFANYLINPIKKLAKASIRISSGDLDIEAIHIDSQDEVGVLADSFNIMSQSINSLVSDLKQKVIIEKKLHEEELHLLQMKQLLKDSQFQALQSQINPHFLFNTLNTISRTAMFESAEDTLKLTQALAQLFRYKLRNDKSMIPIKEELDIIDEYVYLQQVRFKERLEYERIVEPSCEKILVPIFTLQPLIENAIIHGIEPKIKGGKIRVRIYQQEQYNKVYVVMQIMDSGIGMDKERLKEVLKFDTINNRSIGVNNVYQRFKLTFQNKCSFKILSKKNMGTFIEMKFEIENQESEL
ncbi:histidine kinase [Vallitaleaceae bacterium 9-2]